MTRLLFLPVTRFHVRYRVASGRPFSELDRLVLRAIIENDAPTIDDLKETFRIPERPLLENLVTLFHEGWIAMNSQGRFVATEQGHRARGLRTIPLSVRSRKVSQIILMEEVTGQCVAQSRRVRPETMEELERAKQFEMGGRIPPAMTGAAPDQGTVRPLLRVGPNEWIQTIDAPESRGRCGAFLRVVVDPETRRILGLPDAWLPLLEDTLVSEARRAKPAPDPSVLNIESFPVDVVTTPTKITLHDDDVITTPAEHASALRVILEGAPAGSWILIAGERFNPAWLQKEWGDVLATALIRGVNVDLLWRSLDRIGAEESAEAQRERSIARINAAADHEEGGRLRTNTSPSRSRSRFVLVAPPEGLSAMAWIGGWDWLAPGDEAIGVSIRIRDADLLAALAHTATALLETATEQTLSTLPEAWREVAGYLDQRRFLGLIADKGLTRNCSVRLLRDRDIDRTVADQIGRAKERIHIRTREYATGVWVLKHFADEAAEPFSLPVGFVAGFALPSKYENAPVSWDVQTSNAAEAVITDQSLIIGSCLLGGQPPGDPSLKDVGLFIQDGPVVEKLAGLWSLLS